ncbi:MAG TPA: mycofactocin precursor MftA [Mycobacteriales bacterium]
MTVELAPQTATQGEARTASPPDAALEAADALVLADLLVEDVSIDGMCGVY